MRRIPPRKRQGPPVSKWLPRLMKLGILLFILVGLLAWNWGRLRLTWNMHAIQRLGLKQEFSKATELCQIWMTKYPQHAGLQELAGFLLVRQGDGARGMEAYDKARALGLTPSQSLDHLAFGQEYLAQGTYHKALVEFRQLTLLRPRQPQAWFGLGKSWHGVGNIDKAIDAYKKALGYKANDASFKKMLERAINDRRRGTVTYLMDARGEPLAQWRFGTRQTVYMRGYHTAHVVGYNHPKFGAKGIEAAARHGIPGSRTTLTLDLEIQALAEKAFGSRKGSMIVMNPQTGAILAMVSRPTFNPNRLDKDWGLMATHKGHPLVNKPLDLLYEPGSISKIMTAAAWLESSPSSDVFPLTCKGHLMLDGEKYQDWMPHGPVNSVGEAMDVSCNVGFGQMGLVMGPQTLLDWAKKFGFNDATPFELPVTKSEFPQPAGVDLQTAELASGLGKTFRMTPFQGALILAAVANNGELMVPTLIQSVHGLDGHLISQHKPAVWKRVMKASTAKALQKILVQGVQEGISKRAAVAGFTIGGKTGTSGSSKEGLHAWFGCFAPAERPEYVVLVMAEHGGMGMAVAAPVAHKFFSYMIEQEFIKLGKESK